MSARVYADGRLVYDPRLETSALVGLSVTTGLNKGGTASITMNHDHPSFDDFVSYKTIVEIYINGLLRFRGRALYSTDNFQMQRTVLCEGEFCFFQDAVCRPYLYQAAPASVFADVVGTYNSQVEEEKQFKVGTVTVVDANDYIRMESESAESVMDTINKLLERCGGYIVFTTDPADGKRVVHWYASLGYRSKQTIELGANLLDFSRNGSNTNLATAILPYGAKDEESGQRVTIESVNDGKDYIVDEEARALRGFIIKAVTWDDVTQPQNLLRKAQEYLEGSRYITTSLQLSALDLSYLEKSIDSFQVGDLVRVISKPHKVDEAFLLTDRTEDLLNPDASTISLGKDLSTLTDADVAGDAQSKNELQKVTHQIVSDYSINIAKAVEKMEETMRSLISQTSESILMEVSTSYATNDNLTEEISTRLEQTSNAFNFTFNALKGELEAADAEMREQIAEQSSYIRMENGSLVLGKNDGNSITLTLENDLIVFRKNGQQFGWWDGVDFHTGNIIVEVNERAQFGNFAFVPRENGSLSFLHVRSIAAKGKKLKINTICSGGSSYTSISLYVNGEKKYTTPSAVSSAAGVSFSDTYTGVTEAYIVLEGMSAAGMVSTKVNGALVWGADSVSGDRFDLLSLDETSLNIETYGEY